MPANRKPRPGSVLSKLSPAQQRTLYGWFQENLPYHEMVVKFEQEFGFKAHKSTISDLCRKLGIQFAVEVAAEQSTIQAGGVEILITIPEPGKISLAIRPLPLAANPTSTAG